MKLFTDARWVALAQIATLTAIALVSVKGVLYRTSTARYLSAVTLVLCTVVLVMRVRRLPRSNDRAIR